MKLQSRICALALLVFAVTGTAQSSPWWIRSPSTQPIIASPQMAFDSARQEVVLTGAGTNGFETWVWDGAAWAMRNPLNRPSNVVGHGTAYDSVRQELVLICGVSGSSAVATWTWNGVNWTQRSPANQISPTIVGGMAFDGARARTVLFGGSYGWFWGPINGRVWEWDGSQWTSVVPPFAMGAGYYTLGAPVYAPPSQACVAHAYALLGGTSGLWAWLGQLQLLGWSGAGVGGAPGEPMAFDSSTGAITCFRSDETTSQHLGGTWVVKPVAWQCCASTCQGPIAFSPRAMAYDAVRNHLVVYGNGSSGPVTATSGPPNICLATASSSGASCGVPGLQLVADPSARPLVGATARCQITGAPTPLFVMTMGFNTQFYGPFPVPLPLDGVGMTGCVLRHSADILGLSLTPLGADLEYALPVPFTSTLLGFPCHMQGYGFAPGANPAQIAMTNMLTWIVGNQ